MKQGKKTIILKKVRIVILCGERIGEKGISVGKQNQNESRWVGGRWEYSSQVMGTLFPGPGTSYADVNSTIV